MRADYRFVCTLPNGLHARPASLLAECAGRFAAPVRITRERDGGAEADLRSVLSVVGLDVRLEDACVIVAEGEDAPELIAALRHVVEHVLEKAEQAAEAAGEAPAQAVHLPVILRRLGVAHAGGRAVCAGAGIGVAVHAGGLALPEAVASAKATDATNELAAARRAVDAVRGELSARARATRNRTEAALLDAHQQIASDPALWKAIEDGVRGGMTAPQAVFAAAERLSATLRAATSAYVRDRALDVQDIAMQALDRLLPAESRATEIVLREGSVVFAEALTANQLLKMDRRRLKGLALGKVGQTSHTVILARNLGLPCVIDLHEPRSLGTPGMPAVVDGDGGFVIADAGGEVAEFYKRDRVTHQRRDQRTLPVALRPAVTDDGQHLEVGVNATDGVEIAAAVATGADGVGLFRTEFLYLDREEAPSEDEQFAVYAEAVRAADGRPVIFRTFDIGGDKPAPYLGLPEEENPFLGWRGLRLYKSKGSLIDTQLRALLRAGAGARPGTVKVMAPMVSVPSEAAWFRDRVRAVGATLAAEGLAHAPDVPVGVMIEVPSVALSIDQFAEHVDFFSIGTNDLCQYWLAADRGNHAVASLCDPHHPSFLRLLRAIVREARASDRWIGVCGEMGGRLIDLPLFVGLGVNEISASSRQVAALKGAVAQADAGRCRELLEAACNCRSPQEVEALLGDPAWKCDRARTTPIVDPACIEVGCDAGSKEYAIKAAVDLLYIAGRSDRPRAVEEAVWAREETYSTGLGYGFAVPHCKSDAVNAPTLAVVKLDRPVEWGSMDGKPVGIVLLLAVPADAGAGGHMKIFATLARRLMHESFREGLEALNDPAGIEAFLRQELSLS